jgi:hypothetical protein
MQPLGLGLPLLAPQPINPLYINKSKFHYRRPHATFEKVNGQTSLKFTNIPFKSGTISPKYFYLLEEDKRTIKYFRDLLKNPTIETTNKFLENVKFVFAINSNYDYSNPNLVYATNDEYITEENKIILQNLIDECKKDGILINICEDNKDLDVEYYEYCVKTYLDKVEEIINIQKLSDLPKDVLDNMSSFVSGEKGTIIQQLYTLKSKLPQKPFDKNIFVEDYEL